jgi:serine/threonine protein kinase
MLSGLPYSFNLDIWCIGVLCYELLVSKPPFFAKTEKETEKLIKSVNFTIPKNLNQEAKKFIKKVKTVFLLELNSTNKFLNFFYY